MTGSLSVVLFFRQNVAASDMRRVLLRMLSLFKDCILFEGPLSCMRGRAEMNSRQRSFEKFMLEMGLIAKVKRQFRSMDL